MRASESFPSRASEAEPIKEDPATPPGAESLGNEQLGRYRETAAEYIAAQNTNITDAAMRRLEGEPGLSPDALASAQGELAALEKEAKKLRRDTEKEIVAASGGESAAGAGVQNLFSKEPYDFAWKRVLDTPAGAEFSEASKSDYAMREFVRNNPDGARQINDAYQKELGEPHPALARAYSEVDELRRNPPEIPAEDPKYVELAGSLQKDARYQAIRAIVTEGHKKSVFGTTDFSTIPHDVFMERANTPANLNFAPDKAAERVFQQQFPDKARLYGAREQIRVYRDPDGMVNRYKDPSFRKMFEPNSRGVVLSRVAALEMFVMLYPEKARGYAERYPDLRQVINERGQFAQSPRDKEIE